MAELGRDLLTLARGAIEGRTPPTPAAGALAEPGATFVTLTRDGKLRGCIGSLEAWRPLAEDVRANARAAAFRDPRFPPLRPDEVALDTGLPEGAASPHRLGHYAWRVWGPMLTGDRELVRGI